MGLFGRKNSAVVAAPQPARSSVGLAEMALNVIHDGVIIVDQRGVMQFINPAAVTMTNCGAAQNALGLDFGLLLRLFNKDGSAIPEPENQLNVAVRNGVTLDRYVAYLVNQNAEKSVPIMLTVLPIVETGHRIITFRNITKELEEDSEQAEFISTASHEMRTPVASIEGYLGLALNPQTASIDERARGYLTAAHEASQHLGNLFRNLLDVTKMDDGKIKPQLVPVELYTEVKKISDGYSVQANEKKMNYRFGTAENDLNNAKRLQQMIYCSVDMGFLREIMGNLIENAIKYTIEGGTIYVNVSGDEKRAIISVADTGIGISAADLQHIFQKFYRADNTQTRTIGGTGLGLYLVKQQTEAMGGSIWAESTLGKGTTFYVSLPRINSAEYEKRMIALQNQQQMQNNQISNGGLQ